MQLLFLRWGSFIDPQIERTLKKQNLYYKTFDYAFLDWEKDEVFCEKLRYALQHAKVDTVFSVNYSPLVSIVCEELGRTYISWIYDSPIHIRDLSTLKNGCNQIYIFDYGMVEQYKKMGIPAKHLPLAVDCEAHLACIRKGEKGYNNDVAMVGQLYQTQYQQVVGPLSEYRRGYFEGLLTIQRNQYDRYLLPEWITEELLNAVNEEYKKQSGGTFQIESRELEFLLAKEVTRRERHLALYLLSQRFPVSVYSKDKSEQLPKVNFKDYVDYHTKMPLVFANTKVNLNISLRTIQTGIPLRVLDILGCGGFLISNYQAELEEYFRIGQELEVYYSLEDLLEKAEFYLKNDGLRNQIANAGLACVQKYFTYEERIKIMLQ